MKSLLFVAPHVGYGGAEKNFIGIANYAVENGYKVYLLTEEGRENSRAIHPNIVQMKAKIDASGNMIKKYFQAVSSIRKAMKTSKADVVISFIELWRSASVLATRFTKTKCIVSERADPYTRSGRYNKIIFMLFSMADGYVFQTRQARDFFSEKVRRKSVVIPNPVFKEDALQEYMGEKRKIIVNIARLDIKQKRQDLIIEAFDLIKNDFPEYRLYLYGDGCDRSVLEDKIEKLQLKERVFLKGVTHDVYKSLGEAEIMVLASDYEGIPNAIIESMCVGVPVISTKCSPGGAEFLIENGSNGLLVEKGDVNGIAEAIRKLLKNEQLYNEIKRNGFNIKKTLNSDLILPKWTEYIEEVIKR